MTCPFDANRVHACLDPDSPSGKCAVGCGPCPDHSNFSGNNVMAYPCATAYGERWFRPSPTRNGRDAWGIASPLESFRPKLISGRVEYESAPCHFQDGRECFDAIACECAPRISSETTPSVPCVDGTPNGAFMISPHPGCFLFGPDQWPPAQFWCRHVSETGVRAITVDANPLVAGNFLSTNCCAVNQLIGCTGRVVSSPCVGAPGNNLGEGQILYFWSNQACREQRFNYCQIRSQTATMQTQHGMRAEDLRVLDIKNLAIKHVFGGLFADGTSQGTRFDRLDSDAARLGNTGIGFYVREWHGAALVRDGEIAVNSLPVLLEMPNCYLRQSRCPIACKVVINKIVVRAHINAYIFARRPPTVTRLFWEMWPAVRFSVDVSLGVRATIPTTPCVLSRPWSPDGDLTLEISQSTDGTGVPTVVGDELVLVYPNNPNPGLNLHGTKGPIYNMPLRVLWRGHLGAYSRPAWENRWPESDRYELCIRLANSLTGINVPGQRSVYDWALPYRDPPSPGNVGGGPDPENITTPSPLPPFQQPMVGNWNHVYGGQVELSFYLGPQHVAGQCRGGF